MSKCGCCNCGNDKDKKQKSTCNDKAKKTATTNPCGK